MSLRTLSTAFLPKRSAVAAATAAFLAIACPTHVRADAASDLQTLKQRLTDEIIDHDFDSAQVARWLAAMKPDGSFGDIDYADTRVNDGWPSQMHLERLKAFTSAYASKNKPESGDAKFKSAALGGVDFWLAKDFQNKNWFWNQIGVPGRLAPTLLIFWADLSPAQQDKAMEILGRAKVGGSGANLVWLAQVAIQRAILAGDAAAVGKAYAAIAADVQVNPKQSDGPQADNTFLYHGPLLYSWGYGIAYLRDQAHIMAQVAGTSFAFPAGKAALVRDWTLDGAQWMTRGNGVDFGAVGRSVSRKDVNSSVLIAIGRDLLTLSPGREDELRGMIARQGGDFSQPLVGNHSFWRADLMCHHRAGWYASARLYSARTKNTEWGNGEALKSFYLADGATQLMRDGNEYFDIFPVWDWQHVPGTTVEQLPGFGPVAGKPADANDGFTPNRNGIVRKTTETFVGGASDGQYGVFGGKFSRGPLAVRRGWFFFDDEFVCLGSGLNCTSDNAVHTTLDQSKQAGRVQVSTGGAAVDVSSPQTYKAAQWVLNGTVGYLFPQPVDVRVSAGEQRGSWSELSTAYANEPISEKVFQAYIDHGTRPGDASFAFVVLPQTDAASLVAAAAAPPVVIGSNTAGCQAVWHPKLRRGAAIFFTAGVVELTPQLKITVDQPCAVLLSTSAEPAVTVSNPENKPLAVKVTVDMNGKSSNLKFDLPGGDKAGSSVTLKLAF